MSKYTVIPLKVLSTKKKAEDRVDLYCHHVDIIGLESCAKLQHCSSRCQYKYRKIKN